MDIIVEGAVLLPVLSEKAERIVVSKVLKLDQCVLPVFVHHSLHELVNQVIISLRTVSLLVQTHVERILEKSLIEAQEKTVKGDKKQHSHTLYGERVHVQHSYLVVCANVYYHRKTFFRSNSSTGSVQAKFTNGNAHSINTQVS